MSELIETKPLPTFVKKKHELDKLLKSLEKAVPEAVALLVEIMSDDKVPVDVRMKCASKLIDSKIDTVKQINADEMARLVAEYKIGSGGKLIGRGSTAEEKDNTPALDFDNIREV